MEVAEYIKLRFLEPGTATTVWVELLDCWNRTGNFSNSLVWESFTKYLDPGRLVACSGLQQRS